MCEILGDHCSSHEVSSQCCSISAIQVSGERRCFVTNELQRSAVSITEYGSEYFVGSGTFIWKA
jgi:hypothetical protein